MRTRLWLTVVVLAFAMSGFALGCGDDNDDREALSKPEYVERANAICAETEANVQPLFERYFSGRRPPSAEDMAGFAEKVAPLERKTLASLGELPAPEGDEETVSRFLDSATEATDTLEAAVTDLRIARRILREDPFREAEMLASEYGLEACGRGDG